MTDRGAGEGKIGAQDHLAKVLEKPPSAILEKRLKTMVGLQKVERQNGNFVLPFHFDIFA